jgi:ankyrin repeat protein
MVNLLLKFKANPNDSRKDGLPLIVSAQRNSEIVQALLDAGAKVSVSWNTRQFWLLQDAVQQDFAPTVEVLLKHGADPNERDADGNTALHVAAWRSNPDRKIYELLLAYHANPNAQNNKGETPLQRCLSRDPREATEIAEIAALLRQHGALDNPPRWNVIEVNRLSGHNAKDVYAKGTNDWNHFTLLETILNYYIARPQAAGQPFYPHENRPVGYQTSTMPFPVSSSYVPVMIQPTKQG